MEIQPRKDEKDVEYTFILYFAPDFQERVGAKATGYGGLEEAAQAVACSVEHKWGKEVLAALYLEGDYDLNELPEIEFPPKDGKVYQLFVFDEEADQ